MNYIEEQSFQGLKPAYKPSSTFDFSKHVPNKIFDTAPDADHIFELDMLAKSYIQEIFDAELRIRKEKMYINSAILSICDCKNKSILCGFTKKEAIKLFRDYCEYGFAGDKVKKFMQLVKDRFFEQKDNNYLQCEDSKNLSNNIECIKITFGSSFDIANMYFDEKDDRFMSASIVLHFIDVVAKKRFWLQIPVIDNVVFLDYNYDDEFLGKYVLSGIVTVKEKAYNSQKFAAEFTDENKISIKENPEYVYVDHKRVLAAEFSAVRVASAIKKFLTTNELDNNDIKNRKRCAALAIEESPYSYYKTKY